MDPSRARPVKEGRQGDGPVVYWMSRDQRALDNPALLLAQERAAELGRPLVVAFALAPSFLGATLRQYAFMLRSLAETARDLDDARIGFRLLTGGVGELTRFIREVDAAVVVEDFDPLGIKAGWKREVRASATCPFWEVDAHNIVPCWLASTKREWAARTFRPKVAAALPRYLEGPPPLREHPVGWDGPPTLVDADRILEDMEIDRSVREVGMPHGRRAGEDAERRFIRHRLERYPEDRNDPNRNALSGLSPYLHFGIISPLRVALDVRASEASDGAKSAFLEELVVRRELSDNFCYHQGTPDRYASLPEWSRRTLERHAGDQRGHMYSLEELEAGETADDLWNASQMEMVRKGKMHGYLRMYWGKKVLEWSPSPREAIERLVWMNDRYELDGRDPNGYVGILWCLGLHDRPWREREVFGTVRYMSTSGVARKFDTAAYVSRNLGAGSERAPRP